ncbi:MAG TPA: DUF4388 domain-containing protein [Gemmatimonadaceae bacterium]|jgi:hypothetical protein
MAIEGPLQDIGIHDVFQLLDLTRKSGRLRVHSAARANEGSVYFRSGAVVGATMRENMHSLGALLRRAGKVTDEQIERAIEAQKNGDNRRVGEILVAQGAVTKREVERYMRQQMETVVFELFSWREGGFSFIDEREDDSVIDSTIRVSTESLLMEGARRIDEWSRIADKVPSAFAVPSIAPLGDGAESPIDLRPNEWELLSLVDGERTIREIAALLAMSEFDVAKAIYGMISTGLVEADIPETVH